MYLKVASVPSGSLVFSIFSASKNPLAKSSSLGSALKVPSNSALLTLVTVSVGPKGKTIKYSSWFSDP